MRVKFYLVLVALLASFFLPIMAGAQSSHMEGARRTITLKTGASVVTTSSALVIRCWLDPMEYLGCSPFCFNVLVRSLTGANTVTVTCNGQLAYTCQVQAGKWMAYSLGDWNNFLHAGWNTIRIENKTKGSRAEVSNLNLQIIPATWHDELSDPEVPDMPPPPWSTTGSSAGASSTSLPLYSYRGLIHCHTKDSDGSLTLEQLVAEGKKRGWNFVIPTDHNPTTTAQWAKVQRCENLSAYGQFSVIPGAEISTTWKLSKYITSYSHVLALYYGGNYRIEMSQGQPDYQQYVNIHLNAISSLAIAAHPFLVSNLPFKYDFRTAQATFTTKGMESFNSLTSTQEEDGYKKNLELTRNGQLSVAISGSDYHTPFDPQGEERLQRLTQVFATENSVTGIMRSIVFGRTCATAKGAYLEWASYLPYAKSYSATGAPNLVFDVRFGGKINTTVNYELYRDGATSPIVKTSKKVNGTNLLVRFETKDTRASVGEHWYQMRVKGYIETSPIIINRN